MAFRAAIAGLHPPGKLCAQSPGHRGERLDIVVYDADLWITHGFRGKRWHGAAGIPNLVQELLKREHSLSQVRADPAPAAGPVTSKTSLANEESFSGRHCFLRGRIAGESQRYPYENDDDGFGKMA
jgi:hypothetical protein